MSSTIAALECAAQVSTPAIRIQSSGSPVAAASSARTLGASSAGASVSSSMWSATSISPSPIATRPMWRTHVFFPQLKPIKPARKKIGATAETLNESTWTISVVPTFAPSMIESAGRSATNPPAANEVVIRAVAVLLCRRAVATRPARNAVKRLRSAVASTRRKLLPNARMIPVRTMCRPHRSRATARIRSRRIMVAITRGP